MTGVDMTLALSRSFQLLLCLLRRPVMMVAVLLVLGLSCNLLIILQRLRHRILHSDM